MKNKKIIAIPALLALLGGAAFVAHNTMNKATNDNNSVELNPTSDIMIGFTSTAGRTLNWTNAKPSDITTTITLSVTGATAKALHSDVVGIQNYTINFGGAKTDGTKVGSLNFDFVKNCTNVLDTDNVTVLSATCTQTANISDIYGNAADLVDLVHNANSFGKYTQTGFVSGEVNFEVKNISVYDVKNFSATSADFTTGNKFDLAINSGKVGLVVAA